MTTPREDAEKYYPYWRNSYLAPIIICGIAILICVAALIWGEPLGDTETKKAALPVVLACIGAFGFIGIAGITTRLLAIKRVLDSVRAVTFVEGEGRVAYCLHRNLRTAGKNKALDVIDKLVNTAQFLPTCAEVLKIGYKREDEPWAPITFVTYKRAGTVKYWDQIKKIVVYARGLSWGQWNEVEVGGEGDEISLTIHELGHAGLDNIEPGQSEDSHHLRMRLYKYETTVMRKLTL